MHVKLDVLGLINVWSLISHWSFSDLSFVSSGLWSEFWLHRILHMHGWIQSPIQSCRSLYSIYSTYQGRSLCRRLCWIMDI